MHHNYLESREIEADDFFDGQMFDYNFEAMQQIRRIIKPEYINHMAPAIAKSCLNEDAIADVIEDILELNESHFHAILGNRKEFIQTFKEPTY